jgi:hypothetical protein
MDLSLLFEPVAGDDAGPDWAYGVLYEEGMTAENLGQHGVLAEVEIPPGTTRVVMDYFASGHCTDGRGADEFESKDNVISVDGKEVHRFRPWREDCRRFREVNPYCRRWSDGSWSSDYSRSGWCPGDKVLAHEIDLSPYLTPEAPDRSTWRTSARDADGITYWRVSSHLIGWRGDRWLRHPPPQTCLSRCKPSRSQRAARQRIECPGCGQVLVAMDRCVRRHR